MKAIQQPGFKLAIVTTVLATVVIILGSFTRLVDAGLGCPDWPGCYGHLLWPNQADEIAVANQNYQNAKPVDIEKTWPEMVHRYFAGSLGLFILGLAIMAFKRRSNISYPWRLPIVLLVLVIWQAVFGMWTVTMKLLPQVVTIHLLGGFATFSLLVLLSFRLSAWRWQPDDYVKQQILKQQRWIYIGLVLVLLQIMLGGWLAANYAALACVELPTCLSGEYFPKADYISGLNPFQQLGDNTIHQTYEGGILSFEARVAIHIVHRVGAFVVTAYVLWLMLRLMQLGFVPLNRYSQVVIGLLMLQILLGLSNVYFSLPLVVAVAHNYVGALLLASFVLLSGHLYLMQRQD